MNRLPLIAWSCVLSSLLFVLGACESNPTAGQTQSPIAQTRDYPVEDLLTVTAAASYFEPHLSENKSVLTDQLIEELTQVIQQHTEGDVAIQPGRKRFRITASTTQHRRIEDTLDRLRQDRLQAVSMDVRFIQVDAEKLDALGIAAIEPRFLTGKQIEKLHQDLEQHDVTMTRMPRVTTHNQQRGSTRIGRELAYVDRYEADSDGKIKPVVKTFDAGAVLEFTPAISPDQKDVVLELRARCAQVFVYSGAQQSHTDKPISRVAEWQTTLSMPDGNTILLPADSITTDMRAIHETPVAYFILITPQQTTLTASR